MLCGKGVCLKWGVNYGNGVGGVVLLERLCDLRVSFIFIKLTIGWDIYTVLLITVFYWYKDNC